MNHENFENRAESAEKISINPSAIESFFDPACAAEVWPEEITTNEAFLEQTIERKKLNDHLNDVFDHLPKPDMPIETAINQGHVTEEQVKKAYESLSGLLESGHDYQRIALYLPFEILPDKKWQPATEELQKESARFKSAYMNAWENLLTTHDVRANFVDGDVLEVEQREDDLPRVVKAAHLIPKLVEKGFMDVKDVIALIKESDDQILKQSVIDTLPVLLDLGLLTEKEIERIKKQTGLNKKDAHTETKPDKMTEKRVAWLEHKEKQEAIESSEIGEARREIEAIAVNDPQQAKELYEHYRENFLKLWRENDPDIKEALEKTFFHLRRLDIIDDQQLEELNIVFPKLAGPFSENLKTMEPEMQEIKDAITSIELNPEISKLIYPVALVFGSRLKGYGTPEADIDVGVFIKPEASLDEQTGLRELLKQAFAHEKIRGEVTEFWLEEKEGNLGVKNFAKPDASQGESYWTHILFGAAWEGNKDVMRELRERLLVPYMYDHGKERKLYLEEIERDALQYRLMHKGYERFYPPQGGIHTPHANSIDGDSMFWDSGYRQLATKLFASRVFLPKVPTQRK